MRDSRTSSDRAGYAALSEADAALLDEAFDRALESWERGVPIPPAELIPGRPDLAAHAERLVALVQDVAVTGPEPGPLPVVPGYPILAELGRGAMGAVYLAHQDRLGGRPVALKVLPAGTALSSRARARFLAEATAIARLRHPNIVTVHDVVREGQYMAFAMEPVDGPSLQELIEHLAGGERAPTGAEALDFLGAGPLARASDEYFMFVARLGAAIAGALGAVHGAGLLHRDVKPSNILLRRDGTPLLSDFGLVRDPESGVATQEGFMGTPAYAPPEQLAGGVGAADARSDVYALGATLYHALTLRVPFAGRAPGEVLELAQRGAVPVRVLAGGVPRDLETIIAKAMAPAPRERYASAGALAEDLERFLAERPIAARPAGVVSRTVKLLRRNRQAFRGTVAGAIGMLVLVGAGIMGLVVMPRWAADARERAWLALLDPRDTANFANTAFWEFRYTGPPEANGPVLGRALGEYEAAVRWQPWDKRTVLERDALAAMASLGSDGRGSPRLSGELLRRAPRACEWLVRWTRVSPDTPAPPLPEGLASRDELIALGMMSYVSNDMLPAVDAWLRLEEGGDAGVFARAGLGLYFIYRQEPGRAYPRLEDADRAFGTVSFLRAAHAEAACGVGDVGLAGLLLEQAQALTRRDEGQLLRVRVLVDLARGNTDAGLAEMKDWYFGPPYGGNSIAAYQFGRWLAGAGDTGRAAGVLAVAARDQLAPGPLVRLFLPMAERWWDELEEGQRLEVVERAIATRCAVIPWGDVQVPLAYAAASRNVASDARLGDLRPLLHGHPLAECGRRLEPYQTFATPNAAPAPEGEELREAAREVLGLETPPAPPTAAPGHDP